MKMNDALAGLGQATPTPAPKPGKKKPTPATSDKKAQKPTPDLSTLRQTRTK